MQVIIKNASNSGQVKNAYLLLEQYFAMMGRNKMRYTIDWQTPVRAFVYSEGDNDKKLLCVRNGQVIGQ